MLETNRALERQAGLKPSWDDIRAETGIRPEAKPDGTYEANFTAKDAEGRKKMQRIFEMYGDYHKSQENRANEREGRTRRIPMKDAKGQVRFVTEEGEDHFAKKHGSRRLVTVTGRRKPLTKLKYRVPYDWEED